MVVVVPVEDGDGYLSGDQLPIGQGKGQVMLECGKQHGFKYPFPFVDLEFELHYGRFHDVDSSQDAFYLCAIEAFREAEQRAGITLLEPVMKIVVISPKEYHGQIVGNIISKRGIIEDTSEDKGVAQVLAKVPLANLFGYTSDLRSATKGQGSFSMEFSHYARVSAELADLPPSVTVRK